MFHRRISESIRTCAHEQSAASLPKNINLFSCETWLQTKISYLMITYFKLLVLSRYEKLAQTVKRDQMQRNACIHGKEKIGNLTNSKLDDCIKSKNKKRKGGTFNSF